MKNIRLKKAKPSVIDLVNGEKLEYACRRKNTIIESLQTSRKWIIKGFDHDGVPDTEEQYHDYYRSFDAMPFAFTDIEMVFNEECKAVDWIFRYANEALARLEKLPLEKLIGQSFGILLCLIECFLREIDRYIVLDKISLGGGFCVFA